jgi:hypothetical protein
MVAEKVDEGWMRDEVRRRGGWLLKFAPLLKGTPDRILLAPGGRVYFIELKTEKGQLSPIQRWWHAKAASLGTEVVVLHGRSEIVAWLEEVMPHGTP